MLIYLTKLFSTIEFLSNVDKCFCEQLVGLDVRHWNVKHKICFHIALFSCKRDKIKPLNAPGTALNSTTCNQSAQLKCISGSFRVFVEGEGWTIKYVCTFPLNISHCLWVIHSARIVPTGQLLPCCRHKRRSRLLPPTTARSPPHLHPRQLVPHLEDAVMSENVHKGRK